MRHNDHEIDKLFREKLQQGLPENHSFDKENDWSKLAMSLSACGLVRTGVMSLGAKIFSYTAKTILIGVMAFVPSVISYNFDKGFSAKNATDKDKNSNILAQKTTENSFKNDFNRKNIFGNNIFDVFLGENLAEKNTEKSTKNRIATNLADTDVVVKDKLFIDRQTTEKTLKGLNNHNPTWNVGDGQTDIVATDKSFIERQTTENQLVISKENKNITENLAENKDVIATDKSFIDRQTNQNQVVISKENKNLAENKDVIATDKSFIDRQTTEKTLKGLNNHNPTWNVGNGQTDIVATDKSFIERKKTENQLVASNISKENKDVIIKDKSFTDRQTAENQLVISKENKETTSQHFLSKVNLFENHFPSEFELHNREIKLLEITQVAKETKFAQKFQITLFSPIGTNLKAQKSKHYASVGVLASISAGVKGAEISGLGNISTGKVEGLQIAGLTNISRGETKGLQIAGLANINKEKIQGLQVAGLANISKNKVKGVQIAGLANVNNEQVDGAQVALLGNVSKKKVRGLQVAVIVNATDTLIGGQIGLVNISKNKARGLQLGLVNVVGENDKVLTIGLVNIVRKGGHNVVEISTSEALYGNVSLKTGVRKFYNIFAVGSRLTENHNKKELLMAYGYGIGSEWDFKKKYNISGELMIYALAPDMKFNKEERGILTQAKVMLGQKINSNWGVFGGVTFNLLNSPNGVNIIDKPFTLFNNFQIKDGNITSWTGLQVGARYFL